MEKNLFALTYIRVIRVPFYASEGCVHTRVDDVTSF